MVDCLADLILRPGDQPRRCRSRSPSSPGWTRCPAATSPARSTATPCPAAVVRELAYALGLLPRPDHARGPPLTPNRDEPDARPDARPADRAEPRTTDADRRRGPTDAEPDRTDGQPTDRAADRTRSRCDVGADGRGADGRATPMDAGSPGRAGRPRLRADRPRPAAAAPDEARGGWATCSACAASPAPRSRTCRGSPIVDEISGQLLALTDAAGIRRAATCGHRGCRTGKTALHPPTRRARPRPATGHPRLPPLRPPRPVRPRPRPALPLPRLPRRRDPLRPRPQPPLARRRHQRRQPVLPVPPPPPAQPPGTRLDHEPPARRRPAMDHPRRRHHHHPPAPLRHRRRPATSAARDSGPSHGHETDQHPRTTPPLAPATTGPRRRTRALLTGRR